MRREYTLTAAEDHKRYILPREPGEAYAFWYDLGEKLGFDPKTVIAETETKFTALPVGHGKHWCFPMALKCAKKPVDKDYY